MEQPESLTASSDEDLLVRFCQGETEAFGTLVRRYERELYGYLRRYLGDSALAEDGWIPVDHRTFATKFENVYAVGDVTSAPVPRVGAIAEGEARTLAEVLVQQIRGGESPAPYSGTATCYIEFGGNRVARFDADFLSGPTPTGSFTAASEEIVASKV